MKAQELLAMAADPREFRKRLLIDADGTTVRLDDVLDPWQRKDFEALDRAWRRVAGQQVEGGYQRAYLERPRGHSKTADLAVMVTWALFAAPRDIRGVAAAADKDQAGLLRQAIRRLLRLNRWLGEVLAAQAFKVTNRRTGAELSIMSSDVAGSWGILPDFIVADELTVWQSAELWESLMSAAAKRTNCFICVIANAGFDRGTSWQWSVREGARADRAWYFSRLDGPQASWISEETLAEQRRMLPPKAFARLWLNQWSRGGGDAISPEDIAAAVRLRGPMYMPSSEFTFTAGLDIGVKRDHSGFVILATNVYDQRIRLAQCRGWVPPVGGQIDLLEVQETVLEAHKKYNLVAVHFDPYQAALMSQNLTRNALPMREFHFAGQNLTKLAMTLMQVFSQRMIDLYEDDALLRDLRSLAIVETRFGFKLESTRDHLGGHADRGIALALALQGAVDASLAVRMPWQPTAFQLKEFGRPSIRFVRQDPERTRAS